MRNWQSSKAYPRASNTIIIIFLAMSSVFIFGKQAQCSAILEGSPYRIMPWHVGQFAVYQIISVEGEERENRYKVSIVGEEEINGKKYFWVKLDVWESYIEYGYNSKEKRFKKNISFKALVPPLNTEAFIDDPAGVIYHGIFPRHALKLAVQINEDNWLMVDPKDFFNHQQIIEDTPYSLTPHAEGTIDFTQLKIDKIPHTVKSPAGNVSCFRFFVDTKVNEPYWFEGFDLWRSPEIPILGLVKMEFSKTKYWKKWEYKDKLQDGQIKKDWKWPFTYLYKKRVPGRRNPDNCVMLLVEYGT